ncbi:MAG: hypothetical protein ACPGLV_14945 [Bacteroidia bacterium]
MSSSSQKHLHVVSFDVPFPPNYGGVIDVFYKIKALYNLGVNITLHSWKYGDRGERSELTRYCKKVIYYKRNRFMNPFAGPLPYIVKTRYNQTLVNNLNVDDSPVLFEGLHTTAPLFFSVLKPTKKIMVRNHNIESDYYRLLAEKETKPFKRAYLRKDAKLLKSYEPILAKADFVAAISHKDCNQLQPLCNSIYVPAFHPNETLSIKKGSGNYCLYHGNLGVAENSEAAIWLVKNVFSKIKVPLIIAGNTAPTELRKLVDQYEHIQLKENLKIAEFDNLIQNAHINVLPTFQPTGIKLKLLNALYKGRYCLVNEHMVINTGLESIVDLANSSDEFVRKIEQLINRQFGENEIAKREPLLKNHFSNQKSAQSIIKHLY